jgi:GNAT superfamily N-acetyltransferase
MPNPLIIRPVAATDFAQWKPLWEGYNRFYGRDALAAEITKTTWSRFFDVYEPVHALVAERDDQLLGLTHYLYLQDLFTSEPARGKGVGRALIEGVYERARIAGAPRVYWQTHESNLTAIKLYDKVAQRSGFVVYRKEISSG